MRTLTLPNLPEGFHVETHQGHVAVVVEAPEAANVFWPSYVSSEVRWHNEAAFALPAEVRTVVEAFIHANAKYEYAERAHAPRNEGELYPVCGAAAFSRHEYDDNPVVATEAEFNALPEESTCWECRSIIA